MNHGTTSSFLEDRRDYHLEIGDLLETTTDFLSSGGEETEDDGDSDLIIPYQEEFDIQSSSSSLGDEPMKSSGGHRRKQLSTDDAPFVEHPKSWTSRIYRRLFGTFKNTRLIMAFCCFLGLFMVYALRVNLSVAITPMKNQYGWDNQAKGVVLSSFFWGYLVLQLPGGWVASSFKGFGKMVFGFGVLGTAAFSILLPLVTEESVTGVVAIRVLIGLTESVTYPALHSLLADWFPPSEAALSAGFVWSGAYVGTAVAFPICGLILGPDEHDTTRWPWLFYGPGLLGVLWWVSWEIFAASEPSMHWGIRNKEMEYIRSGIEGRKDASSGIGSSDSDDPLLDSSSSSFSASDDPMSVFFFFLPFLGCPGSSILGR